MTKVYASPYDRETVEEVLNVLWDEQRYYGLPNPYAPDGDMPKGSSDPAHGGTHMAHMSDLNWAWKATPMPFPERRRAFMHFALKLRPQEIAEREMVSRQAVAASVERAVGRITAWLNGGEMEDSSERDD